MTMAQGQTRLTGRIAVVTGAGNGIGQGIALMFAAQGATVVAMDIDQGALDETLAQAEGRIIGCRADLMDEAQTAAAIERVGVEHGRIDILVPAAAVSVFRWIEDMSLADWQRTLAGELDIVFLVTRAAWPHLRASGRASVITFASANAHMALDGSPALAHCAGKGGILAMTRQLAMEGAPHGIRANSISPGLIVTQQTRRHLASDPGFEAKVRAKLMLNELGQPEDIAWCATWLASDEARWVTGSDIRIDGGSGAW